MSSLPVDPSVRIVLVRHGESQVTVQRTIGGFRTCTGLSDLGWRQAERLRDRLTESKEIDADVLISSNFARAIETAEVIAPALGLDVRIDADFGEHDPGPDIDGMTFDAYVERFGTPDWGGDPDAEVFPGGETTRQFHERIASALDRTVAASAGSTIVISCHGGVVDATFRHLLRAPLAGVFELRTLNTSLTELVAVGPDMWQLARYNDAAHLRGLPAETAAATASPTAPWSATAPPSDPVGRASPESHGSPRR